MRVGHSSRLRLREGISRLELFGLPRSAMLVAFGPGEGVPLGVVEVSGLPATSAVLAAAL